MSAGSILIGVAITLVVGAYLARPFRPAAVDLDQAIETWVAQAHAEGAGNKGVEEPANFCSQCGRRIGSDDRFCPGCGTRLQRKPE